MGWPAPVTLSGRHVTLEPLAIDHQMQLQEAASDGRLWELWYTSIPTVDGMAVEVARRLALQEKESMLPFAVRDLDSGRLVGMTTYMNIDATHRRLEIGSTWYARSVQRTAVNTECKRLMLGHAFETLDAVAVEFRTSYFNHASRRAIERLGAKQDGILRNHVRHADGSLRDTVVFSILSQEWRAVKSHLEFQLSRAR